MKNKDSKLVYMEDFKLINLSIINKISHFMNYDLILSKEKHFINIMMKNMLKQRKKEKSLK